MMESTMFKVRWMIRRDMKEVLEIENLSFEMPWTEEEFIRCLRRRTCIGMVAEVEERVVGYMVYDLHKTSLELLTIAVDPDFRRSGIGAGMLDKLKAKLSLNRRTRIACEVSEENIDAHLWLRSCGFRATGVVRNAYETCDADAYKFVFRHSDLVPVNRSGEGCQ